MERRGPFLNCIPWESVTTDERTSERESRLASARPFLDLISQDKPQHAQFGSGKNNKTHFFVALYPAESTRIGSDRERLRIGLEAEVHPGMGNGEEEDECI